MSDTFTCPRRAEDGTDRDDSPFSFAGANKDRWVKRDDRKLHCTYCGSVQPEQFLEYLKGGGELGVTDKNYKAYLGDAGQGKFYYQHFSLEQRQEFIEMLNAKRVQFPVMAGEVLDFRHGPLPFFVTVAD